jgi:hypothetical protein
MNNNSKLAILAMIATTLALGIVSAPLVFADNNSVNVKQTQKTHINQNGGGGSASVSQNAQQTVCQGNFVC